MKIVLNNRDEVFESQEMSIQEIIIKMKYTFPRVVVKLNSVLVRKPQFDSTTVKEGDKLEIIHLISGG